MSAQLSSLALCVLSIQIASLTFPFPTRLKHSEAQRAPFCVPMLTRVDGDTSKEVGLLCDLEQVTSFLWASAFSPCKMGIMELAAFVMGSRKEKRDGRAKSESWTEIFKHVAAWLSTGQMRAKLAGSKPRFLGVHIVINTYRRNPIQLLSAMVLGAY